MDRQLMRVSLARDDVLRDACFTRSGGANGQASLRGARRATKQSTEVH